MYEMLHRWEMRGKGGWKWQAKDLCITILYGKWDCTEMFESHAANSSVLKQMWVMVFWKLTIIPAKNWLLPLFFSPCWLTAKTAHWMWIYIPSSCFWRFLFLRDIYMDCCSYLRSDFRKELLPRESCLDRSHIFCCKQNEKKEQISQQSRDAVMWLYWTQEWSTWRKTGGYMTCAIILWHGTLHRDHIVDVTFKFPVSIGFIKMIPNKPVMGCLYCEPSRLLLFVQVINQIKWGYIWMYIWLSHYI